MKFHLFELMEQTIRIKVQVHMQINESKFINEFKKVSRLNNRDLIRFFYTKDKFNSITRNYRDFYYCATHTLIPYDLNYSTKQWSSQIWITSYQLLAFTSFFVNILLIIVIGDRL